jgi:hypothetical protein
MSELLLPPAALKMVMWHAECRGICTAAVSATAEPIVLTKSIRVPFNSSLTIDAQSRTLVTGRWRFSVELVNNGSTVQADAAFKCKGIADSTLRIRNATITGTTLGPGNECLFKAYGEKSTSGAVSSRILDTFCLAKLVLENVAIKDNIIKRDASSLSTIVCGSSSESRVGRPCTGVLPLFPCAHLAVGDGGSRTLRASNPLSCPLQSFAQSVSFPSQVIVKSSQFTGSSGGWVAGVILITAGSMLTVEDSLFDSNWVSVSLFCLLPLPSLHARWRNASEFDRGFGKGITPSRPRDRVIHLPEVAGE